MEMVREYLIVNFLSKQERKIKETPKYKMYGYFGKPTGVREYSPEMVRNTIYRMFGKG